MHPDRQKAALRRVRQNQRPRHRRLRAYIAVLDEAGEPLEVVVFCPACAEFERDI